MEANAPRTATEIVREVERLATDIVAQRDQLLRDKSELTWQLAKSRADVEQAARDRAELVASLEDLLKDASEHINVPIDEMVGGIWGKARSVLAKHGGAK